MVLGVLSVVKCGYRLARASFVLSLAALGEISVNKRNYSGLCLAAPILA